MENSKNKFKIIEPVNDADILKAQKELDEMFPGAANIVKIEPVKKQKNKKIFKKSKFKKSDFFQYCILPIITAVILFIIVLSIISFLPTPPPSNFQNIREQDRYEIPEL